MTRDEQGVQRSEAINGRQATPATPVRRGLGCWALLAAAHQTTALVAGARSIGESRSAIQRLLNRKRLCAVGTQTYDVDFVRRR